jgi:hypothetical protein
MAFIDDVLDTLAIQVNTILAPFQPNLPPTYPNTATTAGQIVPTLTTTGHPIQTKVKARLANKYAQVSIYSGKVERVMPYIDDYDAIAVVGQPGQAVREVGRSQKDVIVEVWAFDRPSRRAIQDRIRAGLTDVSRQTETDTTVTTLRFANIVDFDDEQSASLYVAQMHYSADFTILQVPQGAATDGYPVVEVDLGVTENAQVLGILLQNRGN